MKRITGLVLVRETGVGIPNLVVSVFDSDLTIDDIRKEDLSANLLRRAGKRISSVLTDAEGHFALSTENLEFPGNEARPDLLLMVLAPEDVLDMNRPYPLPLEERTLYVSTVPRIDAGAEEAYVIRLLQAKIDRLQISTGVRGRDVDSAVRDLTDRRLRAFEIRDGVRARLADRVAVEREVEANARKEAKYKLRKLSALPPHFRDPELRERALYIDDKADLPELLGKLQRQAVDEGLERLVRISKSKSPPTLRLRLTATDLEELGLNASQKKGSGEVSGPDLAAKVRSLVNTLDLVRREEFGPPSPDEMERKYLTPRASASAVKTPKK